TSCKTNASPEGIAIDPSGTHLYVTTKSSPSGSLSVFAIGANGALSPVTCDPTTSCKTPGFPDGIAIDPAGKHVYVSNSAAGSVVVFAIGADGALSPVTCDPTTSCKAGAGAFAVGVDPSGGHVYVT